MAFFTASALVAGVALFHTTLPPSSPPPSPPLSSASSAPSFPPPPAITQPKLKLALCQLLVTADKQANLEAASKAVAKAVEQGADIVVLPEMFNCPYSNDSFGAYSETLPAMNATAADLQSSSSSSPSSSFLSSLASSHSIYLVAGSIPERDSSNRLFNTSLTFSPKGSVVAKHRKVHLFDINVPGKMVFRESDTLTAGEEVTVFDTEKFGRIGVGICYDIRFPELSQLMSDRGASLVIFPGAFNTTTGPLHWELLARSRAVDKHLQLCLAIAVCSPGAARSPAADYQAWGHSTIVSPWGGWWGRWGRRRESWWGRWIWVRCRK